MKSCYERGRGRVAGESLFVFKSRRLIGFQANYFLILDEPAVSTAPKSCSAAWTVAAFICQRFLFPCFYNLAVSDQKLKYTLGHDCGVLGGE